MPNDSGARPRPLAVPKSETVLRAILAATPLAERSPVCVAWEGLLPERREFLAAWSPAFIAGWLRGLLSDWDDRAPLNALPEGGYVRRVAMPHGAGGPEYEWCRVSTLAATVGELIHCSEERVGSGARITFSVGRDGFATAIVASRAPNGDVVVTSMNIEGG